MRILIVQTAFLGDCILTTPLIRRTRECFSQSDTVLSVLTTPQGAQIFDCNPRIDEIITYDKRSKNHGTATFFGLINDVFSRKFDLAILPHRSFRSGLVCSLGRIERVVGFEKSSGAVFYTKKVPHRKSKHQVERMLDLLEPLSCPNDACSTEVFPGPERHRKAIEYILSLGLSDNSKFITIAPGSVWGTKRYPPSRYAALINKIFDEQIVEACVLIGGPSEKKLCGEIIRLSSSEKVFSSAGKFDILTSGAIIKRSALLIGNDSAPAHLSAAVKTPTIAIFGPTVREFGFVPYGDKVEVIEPKMELKCRPCSPHGKMNCPRKDHICMQSISTDQIMGKVHKLLQE